MVGVSVLGWVDVVVGVAIGAAVAVVLTVLVLRRRRDHTSVFGSIPDGRPGDPRIDGRSPIEAPVDPRVVRRTHTSVISLDAEEGGSVRDLTEGLQQALADGDLTDEEIQALLPGATVTRHGDEIRLAQDGTATRSIEVDGTRYDRVEDIPDQALREMVRKLLDP